MNEERWTRLFDRAEWMDRAACAGLDNTTRNRLFFPMQGSSIKTVNEAKAICATCPVRDECLEFALDNGERFGIWGGHSERERRVMRRQRGLVRVPIQHGTANGYKRCIHEPDGPCWACSDAYSRYTEYKPSRQRREAS